ALAALIFGKWNPWTVLGAAFFFGFMKTLGQLALINDTLKSFEIPMEFYNALPYIMTLIALVIFSRNIVGPKAAGEPYDPGKR
ncbi:MAG: ABC transporter permease, partial [Turicibacter sp.]